MRFESVVSGVVRAVWRASLLGGMVALTPSCSSSDSATPASKPKIALIAKALNDPYQVGLIGGATADQMSHPNDYDLIVAGTDTSTNVDLQIQLVQQQIDAKVNAIIIEPLDSTRLGPVCQKAIDAGILLVNIDTPLSDTAVNVHVPFVGPNNVTGADKVGTYLATKLQPGDPVAIIWGRAGSITTDRRKLGYETAVMTGGLKLVEEETGMSNRVGAAAATQTILANHPEVKGILSHNGVSSEGVVDALTTAGKLGQIKLGGFDNLVDPEFQGMLKSGAIVVTADQHGAQQGVFAIQYALYIFATHAPLQDRETPVDIVIGGT